MGDKWKASKDSRNRPHKKPNLVLSTQVNSSLDLKRYGLFNPDEDLSANEKLVKLKTQVELKKREISLNEKRQVKHRLDVFKDLASQQASMKQIQEVEHQRVLSLAMPKRSPHRKDIRLPSLKRQILEKYERQKLIHERYSNLKVNIRSPSQSPALIGSTPSIPNKKSSSLNSSLNRSVRSGLISDLSRQTPNYLEAIRELTKARVDGRKADLKGIGLQDTPYIQLLREEKLNKKVKRLDFIQNLDIEKRFLNT